jgi:CheY-like chemotaxis protein
VGFACILIVDDEEKSLHRLRHFFLLDGYDVLTAENGQAALDVLGDSAVDVILTDLHMPMMDGVALARKLRERGFELPLVLRSADRSGSTIAKGMAAVAIVDKSVDLARLERTVRTVVQAARERPSGRTVSGA